MPYRDPKSVRAYRLENHMCRQGAGEPTPAPWRDTQFANRVCPPTVREDTNAERSCIG